MESSPIHPRLPGFLETSLYAHLTIAANQFGEVTVGYTIRSLPSHLPLSLAATPPTTRQHLAENVDEVLPYLLGTVASLLDWPPFED